MPLFVALLTIPPLIKNVGNEIFGFISLSWGLIGYASLFDFGIGRATTQLVAKALGNSNYQTTYNIFKISRNLSLVFGAAGGVFIYIVGYAFGLDYINYSNVHHDEVQYSLVIIAIAIPLHSISGMYRGFSEAYENFKAVSILRCLLGLMNFIFPYFVSIYTTRLDILIFSILCSKLVGLILYSLIANKTIKHHPIEKGLSNKELDTVIKRELLSFGGWYSVSCIINPFLTQIDRFIIGGMLSVAAIAVYAIPFELVTKLTIFASAISTVAFPRYSKLIVESHAKAKDEFNKWLKLVSILMATVCLLFLILLPLFLEVWIGDSLNRDSVIIGQILCIGVFLNAVGIMYFTWIHARGKSNITAKFHLVELPIYITLLYFFS